MRPKTLLRLALGSFVLAALGFVGWQSIASRTPSAPVPPPARITASVLPVAQDAASSEAPAPVRPAPVAESPSGQPASTGVPAIAERRESPASAPVAVATPHKVVATYFHGDVRCATCRKVEAYAKEAVEAGFGEQIAGGLVEFRAVNVDREENRHFIQDYQLTSRSVVVTDTVDGTVERWVKLDDVWGLVGNHDAYLVYVQDAVRAYVEN